MAITASVALGNGIGVKLAFGSLIGGALGFLAGRMTESNPNSRLAKHIRRFGNELSSDPELSIDLFNSKFDSSNNNIDYESSRREFLEDQKKFSIYDDNNDNYEEYQGTRFYRDYRDRLNQNISKERDYYDRETDTSYRRNYDLDIDRRNYDSYRRNYDLDNDRRNDGSYRRNYDLGNDRKNYNSFRRNYDLDNYGRSYDNNDNYGY